MGNVGKQAEVMVWDALAGRAITKAEQVLIEVSDGIYVGWLPSVPTGGPTTWFVPWADVLSEDIRPSS